MENDIFNLSPESFVNPEKKKGGNNFYQPKADDGRDGVYQSVVRFLPFHKDPNNSKVQKYYVWIQDVVAGENFAVDCPSTIGQKSVLKDTYWKLKNSTSASEQALADNFSRAENFYSLVQIVKDPQNPDLEGKIMVFKFGKKINDKIEAQLKPLMGAPCNPYDLFEGKLFGLHITKKQKWNNYDNCDFVGDKGAIVLPGEENPIEKTKEDMGRVLAWLKENSPELDKNAYKPWTEEVTQKVNTAIKNIIPDGRIVDQLLTTADSARPSTGNVSATPTTSASTESAIDEVASATTDTAAVTESAAVTPPAADTGMDDLYDSL